MNFEKDRLYHFFNRGNNGEKIFYSAANYKYFLEKINYYILPFSDVMAWCLMPNHFHLMIYVRREEVFSVTFNQAIGQMLCTYARAINAQENRTGSLFQQHSKAICLNGNNKLKPSWYKMMGATKAIGWNQQDKYPRICMEYIHLNPVRAGLVMNVNDWRWSSYHEIYGKGNGIGLVNLEVLKNVLPL